MYTPPFFSIYNTFQYDKHRDHLYSGLFGVAADTKANNIHARHIGHSKCSTKVAASISVTSPM